MDENGCGLILLIMVGVFLVGLFAISSEGKAKLRRIEEARLEYLSSLEALKHAPADPNLKGETLRLGRRYSNLTRERKGVALFDEVALMNDINAASAAAMAQPSHFVPPKTTPVKERLLRSLSCDLKAS